MVRLFTSEILPETGQMQSIENMSSLLIKMKKMNSPD